MAVLLKIKDWSVIYENNRTRDLKHMAWLPLPNRHDGDGYTELLDHPDGAAHFGAWTAIVQVASRCDPRGTLLRGGGEPHDSASISRMTRISKVVFDAAIPRLIHIGWLTSEVVASTIDTKIPHEGAGEPQEGAAAAHLVAKNGMNGTEGTEGKKRPPNPPAGGSAGFELFWDAYPTGNKKRDHSGNLRRWKRKNLELQTPAILAGLEAWKSSEHWRSGFVCLMSTFINQDLWLTSPDAPAAPGCTDVSIGLVETRDPTPEEIMGGGNG